MNNKTRFEGQMKTSKFDSPSHSSQIKQILKSDSQNAFEINSNDFPSLSDKSIKPQFCEKKISPHENSYSGRVKAYFPESPIKQEVVPSFGKDDSRKGLCLKNSSVPLHLKCDNQCSSAQSSRTLKNSEGSKNFPSTSKQKISDKSNNGNVYKHEQRSPMKANNANYKKYCDKDSVLKENNVNSGFVKANRQQVKNSTVSSDEKSTTVTSLKRNKNVPLMNCGRTIKLEDEAGKGNLAKSIKGFANPVPQSTSKKKKKKSKKLVALQTGKINIVSAEVYSKASGQLNSISKLQDNVIAVDINDSMEYPELGGVTVKKISKECSTDVKETFHVVESDKVFTELGNDNSLDVDYSEVKTDIEEKIEKKKETQSEPTIDKPKVPTNNIPLLSLLDFVRRAKPKLDVVKPDVNRKTSEKSSMKIGETLVPSSINQLDSSRPIIKRGKEREKPKSKKPSALKKIILTDRMLRKQQKIIQSGVQCSEKEHDENGLPTSSENTYQENSSPDGKQHDSSNIYSTSHDDINYINQDNFSNQSDQKYSTISTSYNSCNVDKVCQTPDDGSSQNIDSSSNSLNCCDILNSFSSSNSTTLEYRTINENEICYSEDFNNKSQTNASYQNVDLSEFSKDSETQSLDEDLENHSDYGEKFFHNISMESKSSLTEDESDSVSNSDQEHSSDINNEETFCNDCDSNTPVISINEKNQNDSELDCAETDDIFTSHSNFDKKEMCDDKFFAGLESLLKVDKTKPDESLVSAIKVLLHTKKFREYCDHFTSKDIDFSVTSLLNDLVRFQDRMHQKNPVKARVRRRLIYGIKEITKHMKLKKLKCVIIAPDIENVKSKGGLNDLIEDLKTLAQMNGIPYIFALQRNLLGKLCHKPVPVSCIGIFNYEGSEKNFKELLELQSQSKHDYTELTKCLAEKLSKEQTDALITTQAESPVQLYDLRISILKENVILKGSIESVTDNTQSCDKKIISDGYNFIKL